MRKIKSCNFRDLCEISLDTPAFSSSRIHSTTALNKQSSQSYRLWSCARTKPTKLYPKEQQTCVVTINIWICILDTTDTDWNWTSIRLQLFSLENVLYEDMVLDAKKIFAHFPAYVWVRVTSEFPFYQYTLISRITPLFLGNRDAAMFSSLIPFFLSL